MRRLLAWLRPRRKPIAVAVHTDSENWDGDRLEYFVTTLVMNDGTVWRYNARGEGEWTRFYAPGEESK